MHYYPHHIGDFIADTARLTDSQCMAYLRLIWHYYDTEKPLENDPESLAFRVGANSSDISLILKHYFILDGDVWRKTRCDNVIGEYHGKADKARKGAGIRWENERKKRTDSERNANASETNANASKSDANQEPITNNQKPILLNNTPQAAQDENETLKLPSLSKTVKAKFDPESLINQMPQDLGVWWLKWIDYRKSRKLSTKEPTWRAQAANLSEWGKAGYDPCQAIKSSIENGWQGLFEPKQVYGLQNKQPAGALNFTSADYNNGINPDGSF